MSRLPHYLLKATDVEMDRWRTQAAARGSTFATYVRSSLELAPRAEALARSSHRRNGCSGDGCLACGVLDALPRAK